MKKHSAVIAALALLSVAAAFAVTIACNSAAKRTPDFVFSDPSPAVASTVESEPPPLPPAQTEESSEIGGEPQGLIPSVITSNDPRNFSKIVFDGFDIIIEGVSADRLIVSACLFSDGVEEPAEYDGDSYRIVLKDKKTDGGFDTIYIYTAAGVVLDYRVCAAPDGFKSIDTSDIAENNFRLAQTPADLPIEGVLQYITPDGDPSRAREVMAQVEEISDRICEGIPDDYAKAMAISEWVAENIYYDFDASESSVTAETVSLSHVLETHRTVCGGFSNIYSALCAAQGITVYNVQGEAVSDVLNSFAETDTGSFHEWNYAVIDGKGVWADACWETYNYYRDGQYVYGKTRSKYFDISDSVMSYDHRVKVCWSRDYYAAIE
ncbi:MAG: transglutaminase domain-containing protein [Oscillospiraceae bacterium]|nr:transglutaminase domain-containing protein [Oscillospiraceae bacterium]